jgi:poly-beta-1,6-N-acetyl-D-glucosamine synthase
MQYWRIIFIISSLIVFYNYVGYALIVYGLNMIKKSRDGSDKSPPWFPTVSFIVAAFNEEDCIREKILNSLDQDYPAQQIEYIFITDGSTDNTSDIIASYPAIKGLHHPERNGKSAALNRAVLAATHDILIFSDANTVLNRDATKNIARHYQHKDTGGVAGEKKVISSAGATDEVGAGEGLYWKYESFLKKIDAEFYSVVGAAGELFSIRRDLFEPLPDNVILDDFVASLRTAQKGFRIEYEPEAYAMELPSFSIKDEQKRKIRIAAGGFQAIGMLWPLLLFRNHVRLSFLYISHRVLRWTLSPLCLILTFISSFILAANSLQFSSGPITGSAGNGSFFSVVLPSSPLYLILFAAQLLFYSMAILAAFIPPARCPKILKLPYYFTFMNISVIFGLFRFLKGGQSVKWEKAKRAVI